MKIQDLIIDPKSLGSKLWLVDVVPVYEYKDNRRTDNITGYRYVSTKKLVKRKEFEQFISYKLTI